MMFEIGSCHLNPWFFFFTILIFPILIDRFHSDFGAELVGLQKVTREKLNRSFKLISEMKRKRKMPAPQTMLDVARLGIVAVPDPIGNRLLLLPTSLIAFVAVCVFTNVYFRLFVVVVASPPPTVRNDELANDNNGSVH
jgi:hypothetical protein